MIISFILRISILLCTTSPFASALNQIFSGFTEQTFSQIPSQTYKIFDKDWNELSFSTTPFINSCLGYSVLGGESPDGTYLFGSTSSNPVKFFVISNLKIGYPILSVRVFFTLIFFSSTSNVISIQLNCTLPTGGTTTLAKNPLLTAKTNDSLACGSTRKIYSIVQLFSIKDIPAQSTLSIQISGINKDAGYAVRDFSVEVAYCNPQCKMCAISTGCSSCYTPATLTAAFCQCNLPAYSWTECTNPVPEECTKYCEPCPVGCSSCVSTMCLSCTNASFFTHGRSCVEVCPLGFFGAGGTCSPCDSSCEKCENSATECTSCVTGLFLYDKTCRSDCPAGFYEQNGNLCASCDNSCLNTARNCISCPDSRPILLAGNCLLDCPAKYYKSSATSCTPCDISCLTCDGSTSSSCLTCPPPAVLLQRSCIAECPPKSYPNNGKCEACDISCQTCKGSTGSDCTSCPTNLLLLDGKCVDKCPQGYFIKDTQCLQCEVQCETCENVSKCLFCKPGSFLYSDHCVDTCPQETETDQALRVCKECPVSAPYHFNGSCVDACPEKTYLITVTKTCMKCNEFCKFCKGPLFTDCLECGEGLFLENEKCMTSCPEGAFANEAKRQCFFCNPSCKSCFGEAENQCESCVNERLFLHEGRCVEKCPEETYANPQKSNLCENCQKNCVKCLSLTLCGNCSVNYFLSESQQCESSKPLYVSINEIRNPQLFELAFTSDWAFLKKNLKEVLKLSIDSNPENAVISSFSIANSSSKKSAFVLDIAYSKSFTGLKYNLTVNFSIDYSKAGYEYFLMNVSHRILLKQYTACSKSEFFNPNSQTITQKPGLKPSLNYGGNELTLILKFSYVFETLKRNITEISSVSIQGFREGEFSYSFNETAKNETYEIRLKTNRTITNGPKLTYLIKVPADVVLVGNFIVLSDSADIRLFDYIPLSEGERGMVENAVHQKKSTDNVATGAAYANSALASGTPLLLQGLMLTELIYLIKYVDIRYPPNVLEIFKENKQLTTFFFFYKFERNEEDENILPQLFKYYLVSPYFLENNGEQICKNLFILFVAYLFIQLVEENQSKSLVMRLLKTVYSVVVWEMVLFFMLLFLQKFVFFTFTNISFQNTRTYNGILNLIFACFFVFFEFLLMLHLFIILNIVRKIKKKLAIIRNINVKNLHIPVDSNDNRLDEENNKQGPPTPNIYTPRKENNDSYLNLPSPILFQNEKESPPAKQNNQFFLNQSISDSIKTDACEKGTKSSITPINFLNQVHPSSFSPSKFKKNAVSPKPEEEIPNSQNITFDEKDVNPPEVKPVPKHLECRNHIKNFFRKFITSLLNLRLVQYFYFPKNEEQFLKQYEFLHLELRSNNFYQSYYPWFDYLRQVTLSILASAFDFHPFPQIFLINLVNILYICYYIFAFPFNSKALFFCSLISELITESALISCMGLAILDLNEESKIEMRLFFGWIIVSANLALLYWICLVAFVKILLILYNRRKKSKVVVETPSKVREELNK